MKILYCYKDFVTDDIREIVYNNKLEENTRLIKEEYLPYQFFISRETFFKDVSVIVHGGFFPGKQLSRETLDFDEIFKDRPEKCAATLSGGIDSSGIALRIKPEICYTGYYSEPGFSEVQYAEAVSRLFPTNHVKYEVTESQFIDAIDEYLKVICTPIYGLGGVSEYVILKRLKEEHGVTDVYFGNGGDETFLGYFYNHYIRSMGILAEQEHKYMENFRRSRKNFFYGNIDLLIERLLSRGFDHIPGSPLMKRLAGNSNVYSKMLDVNINCVLPSLMHINNQICKANGITAHNPLTDQRMFDRALSFAELMTDRPKQPLVDLFGNLPPEVTDRTDKQGFPIPMHKWDNMRKMMEESAIRHGYSPEGVNRHTWGYFMIDRWREIFNK